MCRSCRISFLGQVVHIVFSIERTQEPYASLACRCYNACFQSQHINRCVTINGGSTVCNWIVTAIAIQVQAVDGFGVQVGGIIGADEAAPLGGVISCVQIVQARVVIVVIATVANGVGFTFILPSPPPAVKKNAAPGLGAAKRLIKLIFCSISLVCFDFYNTLPSE